MATQQAKRQPNETVLLFHTIFQLKTFSARHFLPVLYIHFPIFFLALLSDVAISPAFSYARVFYIFFPLLVCAPSDVLLSGFSHLPPVLLLTYPPTLSFK